MNGPARVLAALVALAFPTAAQAVSGSSVTMVSDSGDSIGGGLAREYDGANGVIAVSGTAANLTVSVSGGTSGGAFTLEFVGPQGADLVPGVYHDPQHAGSGAFGGVDITGNGRACDVGYGGFEVKDIHSDASGNVDRLWLVYEHHCDDQPAALFGEVRINEPIGDDASFSSPTIVRWPALDSGEAGTVAPLQFVAGSSAQTFGQVQLGGLDAAHFTIRDDTCSNTTIAAGHRCAVWVRYTPTGAGTHYATLSAPTPTGAYEVALQGHRGTGVTDLDMTSDRGDWVGGGLPYAYSPAASDTFVIRGTRTHISFSIAGQSGDWWRGDFAPAAGDMLTAGRTYLGTRWPFNRSGAGLDVSGDGRGCDSVDGAFTINASTFSPIGEVEALDLSFVQHCEHAAPALHGRLRWHAGDTTPPAPWMPAADPADQPAPPPPPPPPGDQSPPPSTPGSPTPPLTSPPSDPPGVNPVASPPPSVTPTVLCGGRTYPRSRVLMGTGAADLLRGGRHGEVALGGGGPDTLRMGRGNDCADGGPGRDLIVGGAGDDVLRGGTGDDQLVGGPGHDVLDCGPGRDVAYAGRGDRTRRCERVIRVP